MHGVPEGRDRARSRSVAGRQRRSSGSDREEASFALALQVRNALELGDNCLALFVERGEALEDSRSVQRSRRGLLFRRHGAAKLVHGAGDLLGVLGIDLDGFVVEVEGGLLNEGLDGAEVFWGDADQLPELEDGGAVLLPHPNDAISLGAADMQVLGAELLPGRGTAQVEAGSRMRRIVSAWAAEQRPATMAKD